jgi:hypothetical protein
MRFFKHILLALALAFPVIADTNVNTKTLQESLDSIDNWLGALAASAGATNVQTFLPGTNIVGASYNSGTEQWAIDWTATYPGSLLHAFPLLDVNSSDDASLTSTALVQGAVFRAYVPPGDYLSVTNFTNSVVVSDSANGWDSTNQTYTVPTDGYYLVGVAYEPNLSTGGGPGTNDNWTIESAVGASIAINFANGTTNNTLFTFRSDADGSSASALDAMGTVPLFLTNNSKVFLYKRHGGSTATLGGNMNWFISAIGGGGGGSEYDFYASYSPPTISPTNVIANFDFVVTNTMPINTGRLSTGIVVNVANAALVSPGVGYRFTPASNKTYQLEFAYSWTALENTDVSATLAIHATFLKNGESYTKNTINSPSLSYVGVIIKHSQANYSGSLDGSRNATDFMKLTVVGNGTDYYDPVFLNPFTANVRGLIHNLTYSIKEID